MLPHDAFAYSDDLIPLSLGFIASVFAHIGVGALSTPGMVALLGVAFALGAWFHGRKHFPIQVDSSRGIMAALADHSRRAADPCFPTDSAP